MASYFRSSVQEFLLSPECDVLARLTLAYAADGYSQMYTEVPTTWWSDLASLRSALSQVCNDIPGASDWTLLLEFCIPRKERRIDIVLLAGSRIIILECKTSEPSLEAFRQVEEYALLLHYFHKASFQRHILPVIVTHSEDESKLSVKARDALRQDELTFDTLPSYWIAPTQRCSWCSLPQLLRELPQSQDGLSDGADWDDAAYFPTPTIIDAARALRTGLKIREVAFSEASEHDIELVTDEIRSIADGARANEQHVICFLTGVPGSGKTLVGLGLAHLSESRTDAIHFMSGNGPLVSVLQEVFRRQAMRDGVPATAALVHAQTLIENVHVFAKNYTERDPDRAPSNHVIIFDEAQRAWNLAQNFNKYGRNYSEPAMLLKIMERHSDWACVIALVGGGQEINSGEAGLEEWGKALIASDIKWAVYASPEVIEGGTSTAGHRLFDEDSRDIAVNQSDMLHLRTSNRSLRADKLASWVNYVLSGDKAEAVSLHVAERFPLFLTRDLEAMRRMLRSAALGDSRYGLVASSGATRLRADGLEPSSTFHADYPWHHWYLAPPDDVRSSYRCEVFATEFEIQGLELDWVGLCWGGDFIWSGESWLERNLRHGAVTRWGRVKRIERQEFRRNAYRVLLTRARQGMVIYVPRGDSADPTRDCEEMDRTAEYLMDCGVVALD